MISCNDSYRQVELRLATLIDDGDPDGETKITAMQAKYPGKRIVVHRMVDSPMRFLARPEVTEGAGPSSVAARIDDDAAERARERLAKLRSA